MEKTVCVYHSIDLDGWMSAAIVRYWFEKEHGENALIFNAPEGKDKVGHRVSSINTLNHNQSLTFMGYNYGDPIPDLSEYDRVIMCDISFPKDDIVDIIRRIGNHNLIWIDHHISALRDVLASNIEEKIDRDGNKYYADTNSVIAGNRATNFAACELTWQYFFPKPNGADYHSAHIPDSCKGRNIPLPKNEMPEIVRLLGRWDNMINVPITDKDELLNVVEFQYGARVHIHNYEDAYEYLINWIEQEKNKHVQIGAFKTIRGWNQISIDIFQTGRVVCKYHFKKDEKHYTI